ncbi:unnamed protein product, partial [Mesorhabditis belari]|uniref:Clc-like protein n=1 Tax=Mesorhabditis belari TaxID=2138241 RepID=A0AAF3FC50_9BILA
MTEYGASRLTRKCSLSVFFVIELVAFTLCLLALLSPTWQYVYLENGKSEHHHGLWLDCVRFLSYVYGDTDKNVETNWRREIENTPFALYYLPDLNCVYKFDYYIDQEDLYDHNHDENRIENDAWQHLFLGHKIAALCAIGVAFLFSFASLLVGICSYCHRTFICASTVLITMAAFFSSIGVGVFYMWANYQDNKIIKEEDMEIYEQQLGWAFHFQLIATFLHLLASVLGCCATSLAFRKGRAKLVKIEVVEGGDESSPLASTSHLTSTTQPFKRSFSAIYRVDSEALQRWEKEYMKNMKQEQSGFKRTASVPNFTKKQRKAMLKAQREAARSEELFTSTSNILSERTVTTGASNTLESHERRRGSSPPLPIATTPKSIMKKSNQSLAQLSQKTQADPSTTYEYLPCPAPSTIAFSTFRPSRDSPSISSAKYDSVYETLPVDNYEEPISIKNRLSNSTFGEESNRKALLPTLPIVSGSAQSIPTQKTTLIDDVIQRPSTSQELLSIRERITREEKTIEEMRRREMLRKRVEENEENMRKIGAREPIGSQGLSIRDIGITLRSPQKGYATVHQSTTIGVSKDHREDLLPRTRPPPTPPKPSSTREMSTCDEESTCPPSIQINTFGEGPLRRSLTNLAVKSTIGMGEARELFSRTDSIPLSTNSSSKTTKSASHRRLLSIIPDEVDRSVGSSTLLDNECLPNSTNRLNYARDAELRLNLFLNDSHSTKESETTV